MKSIKKSKKPFSIQLDGRVIIIKCRNYYFFSAQIVDDLRIRCRPFHIDTSLVIIILYVDNGFLKFVFLDRDSRYSGEKAKKKKTPIIYFDQLKKKKKN